MRNADWNDVKKAQQLGKLEQGIMYNYFGGFKYHYKEVEAYLVDMLRKSCGYCENFIVCERIDGQICVINPIYLVGHGAKGPSHTPKKSKRKPIKGTKPWTKIPYRFEDVEVGDVVVYGNSKSACQTKIQEKSHKGWFGRTQNSMCDSAPPSWAPYGAHILKPYKEPVKPQEEVYQIGDRFEIMRDGRTCFKVMLCRVEDFEAKLIVYEGEEVGNRWSDSKIEIRLDSAVNAEDLHNIIDHSSYTYKKI